MTGSDYMYLGITVIAVATVALVGVVALLLFMYRRNKKNDNI